MLSVETLKLLICYIQCCNPIDVHCILESSFVSGVCNLLNCELELVGLYAFDALQALIEHVAIPRNSVFRNIIITELLKVW